MKRVMVSAGCETPCPRCPDCARMKQLPDVEGVLAELRGGALLLGGGDATRWPHLAALIEALRAEEEPPELWVEAPAERLDALELQRLKDLGVDGVVFHLYIVPERAPRAAPAALGARTVAEARARGLGARARLSVAPELLAEDAQLLDRVCRALDGADAWLELLQPVPAVPVDPAQIETLMIQHPQLWWSGHRNRERGYLPPCALPELWRRRPWAFRSALDASPEPNTTLPACTRCAVQPHCDWREPGMLAPAVREALEPLRARPPWARSEPEFDPVPRSIRARRSHPPVLCTAPWTTLEIVDPDGEVHQCCKDWTIGARGQLRADSSLVDIWNGAGYREARRALVEQAAERLCRGLCPRVHDQKLAEPRLRIRRGAERFEQNQLLAAEDIALGREVMRARPQVLTLCPSTYCNYDCVMCLCGRQPRRELPDSIWDEVEELLPTLSRLGLLGGEPLASPAVMRFLASFDRHRYPDARVDMVTNGALLTQKVLDRFHRLSLAAVTISLNAGTPEVYEQVQRGLALDTVLANIDALMRYRDGLPHPLGIRLSFVVMPANAHTLIEFGELARSRALSIRLQPLATEHVPELDFYSDPDTVARTLGHVAAFERWAERAEPRWLPHIRATAAAIRAEVASRSGSVRLPVLRG